MRRSAHSGICRTFAVSSLLLIGSACGQRPQSAAPAGSAGSVPAVSRDPGNQALKIEITMVPNPPKSGDNLVEANISQANGEPVTDATVTATFRMAAMPSMNMPEMHSTVALIHEGAGRYRGSGSLVMAGTWNATLTVSRSGEQVALKRFSVIAQ
jgi:YtkA-like